MHRAGSAGTAGSHYRATDDPTPPRIAIVTPQQRAVIGELLRDGATNIQIAVRLGISEDTVRSHIKRIFAVTGADNRTHLACLLLRGRVILRTRNRNYREAAA